MNGSVSVIGLGPGDHQMITPQAQKALEDATDIIGYIPYVNRVKARPEQTLHASDNRVETERAQHAIELARQGRHAAIVSSGDPGVFAMAAAVFEILETYPIAERALSVQIYPGITAMLAAAAAAGAPLGHDFCAINLSDNLKPAQIIEKRVRMAAEADFAMAFYNPRSIARPDGFTRILTILRQVCDENRLIIFARAVSTQTQSIQTIRLADAREDMADMRTVVIVGSSQTRIVPTPDGHWVYTPRTYPKG